MPLSVRPGMKPFEGGFRSCCNKSLNGPNAKEEEDQETNVRVHCSSNTNIFRKQFTTGKEKGRCA